MSILQNEFRVKGFNTSELHLYDYEVGIRTASVWTIILASAILWCVIAICYKRRRAREMAVELVRRESLRARQEQHLIDTARQCTLNRHRPSFVDRNSRQSQLSAAEYDEMLTISVSLARTPNYTPEYSPPTYMEAVEGIGAGASPNEGTITQDRDDMALTGDQDLPPPYSSIFGNITSNANGSPV